MIPPLYLLDCRPIPFESDLFSGSAVLWTKGLPTTPEGLFQGQKRKSAITIQGRFKQQVPMLNVISGPEFSRPYKNLPAIWFVEHVLLAVSVCHWGGCRHGLDCNLPVVSSCLMCCHHWRLHA